MKKETKREVKLVIGVLAVILAIVCFLLDTGDTERNQYYGGDAYSGIQNAAAQTARNLVALASITKVGFGSILLISGGYLIVSSLPEKEAEVKQDNEKKDEIVDAPDSLNEKKAAAEAESEKYKDLWEKGILTEEGYKMKSQQIANASGRE